jgi:hypothetical protein
LPITEKNKTEVTSLICHQGEELLMYIDVTDTTVGYAAVKYAV